MGTMCAGCRKAITSSRPTLESHTLVLDSEPVRTPLLRFCLESNEQGTGVEAVRGWPGYCVSSSTVYV